MKLVGVQLDIVWEDKQATCRRALALLEQDPPAPGDLIVFPEMFSTGFSMDVARIHEGETHFTESWLAGVARQYKAYALGGVVNIGADGRGRNQAVVYDPAGGELIRYDKVHPFSFGEESQHYTGGRGVKLFDWNGVKVAPVICYDLRFPELFRAAVKQGAQAFAVIANWPAKREMHWASLLQARAIENQAYVIGVNRVGNDPNNQYSGRSAVIDPRGNVLSVGRSHQPTVFSAQVDPQAQRQYREEFPALKDITGPWNL